jgi:hypothetical protein
MIENMDNWIGEKLDELEDEGLADNTIVFYYADHGGILPRSKYHVYETGTRVPFIIRIPEKYRYLFPARRTGSEVDRLISFVDLAPTLLSIAGIPIPAYMQGNAFLGEQKTGDPEYALMFRGRMDERYDMARAVRSHRYRYIRNYMPYRGYGQHMVYLFAMPSARSWEQAFLTGACNETQSYFWKDSKPVEELYDTENDPWEVNNLAGDPACRKVLEKMRSANREWVMSIHDAGFIPEADLIDRAGKTPAYDYMRSEKVKLDVIIEAAENATLGEAKNLELFRAYLKDDDSAVRYWGATGLLMLGNQGSSALEDLRSALQDESADVVAVSAEALYKMGEQEEARKALLGILESPNKLARCRALNTIDCLGMKSTPEVVEAIVNMVKTTESTRQNFWNHLAAAKWLFEKWGLDPDDYGIAFR